MRCVEPAVTIAGPEARLLREVAIPESHDMAAR